MSQTGKGGDGEHTVTHMTTQLFCCCCLPRCKIPIQRLISIFPYKRQLFLFLIFIHWKTTFFVSSSQLLLPLLCCSHALMQITPPSRTLHFVLSSLFAPGETCLIHIFSFFFFFCSISNVYYKFPQQLDRNTAIVFLGVGDFFFSLFFPKMQSSTCVFFFWWCKIDGRDFYMAHHP